MSDQTQPTPARSGEAIGYAWRAIRDLLDDYASLTEGKCQCDESATCVRCARLSRAEHAYLELHGDGHPCAWQRPLTRTCRGCSGEFDDAECRHPHTDKHTCWHTQVSGGTPSAGAARIDHAVC